MLVWQYDLICVFFGMRNLSLKLNQFDCIMYERKIETDYIKVSRFESNGIVLVILLFGIAYPVFQLGPPANRDRIFPRLSDIVYGTF